MRRPSWTQQASQSSLDDFIAACKDGNVEEVRRIYKENPGLDVNRGSTHGSKALPLAAGNGLADLVRALLELGCNPDNRNRSGNTAAHLAAFCDHVHVLEVLAGHGANLLIKDRTGVSARDVRRLGAVARSSAHCVLLPCPANPVRRRRRTQEPRHDRRLDRAPRACQERQAARSRLLLSTPSNAAQELLPTRRRYSGRRHHQRPRRRVLGRSR